MSVTTAPTGFHAVYEVARKDFLQQIRTKRVLIVGGFMLALLLFIILFIGRFAERAVNPAQFGVSKQNFILAFYFGIGFIGGLQFTQMLAIVLTADGVCSEWANRTIFLLLSRPVSRIAFVTGKLLGNLAIVATTLLLLLSFAYLLLFAVYSGHPSGKEVAGFFGMIGVVILGAAAFSAFSLFISTLTKSTTTSFLLSIASWLIIFPIVGYSAPISTLGGGDVNVHSARFQWSLYLNPASDMQAGVQLLVPSSSAFDELDFAGLNPLALAPDTLWIAILALVLHIVVWYSLAVLIVRRRNFE